MVCFHIDCLTIAIDCRLHCLIGMEMLDFFAYRTVAVMHFTDQNWIPKTVYCICVICKIAFINWNAKITLSRASMVVTYYIKLYQTGANRHNGILMSLLLLVAETKIFLKKDKKWQVFNKNFNFPGKSNI